MVAGLQTALVGVAPLAHPHGSVGGTWLPGVVVLTVAACTVLAVVAVRTEVGVVDAPAVTQHGAAAARPSRHGVWWTTRVLVVAAFLFAIVPGRTWNAGLVPLLAVTVGLPVLVLVSAVAGQVWHWLDPFDTLARVTGRLAGFEDTGRAHASADSHLADVTTAADRRDVRWAALPALAWTAYLVVHRNPFDPQMLGRILAGYTVALLLGCLAAARRSWLQEVEVLGITMRWVGRIRRNGLLSWNPPSGAGFVCGVLLGGLLFEGLHTLVLTEHPTTPAGDGLLLAAVLLSAALGGHLVTRMDRRAGRLGAPGSVIAAAVPMLAAAGVSFALVDNRLLIGVQLLARLFVGPSGAGPDPATTAVVVDPLGQTGLVLARALVLLVGAIVGIRVAARRSPHRYATRPAVLTTEILLALAVLGLAGP